MTDRGFDPFAEDFADTREPAQPAGANDPFEEDFRGLKLDPGTSATGAFVRGAVRGAAPAIGSLPAIGAGAETGGAVGAVFGPFGAAGGALIGGAAAGLGAGYAIGKVQDWALSKFPDSWTEKIGLSERQQKLDEKYHGTASFLGGLAPYAVTMRPGLAPKAALPDNATALQRIMAHPATAHVFGGAVMGGLELGQEAAHGEAPDWSKIAISTGFGVVFNRPTRIGESLIGMGARPVLRLVGREEPAAPMPATGEAVPAPAAAPSEAAAAPAPAVAPAGPPVTAQQWRTEMLERTRTGRPYELSPRPVTVADAADLGVMGPGVTEETFHGSHQRSEASQQTARENKQLEESVFGEPVAGNIHAAVRRMHPELFAEYDRLLGQREEFHRAVDALENPSDEEIAAASPIEREALIERRKAYEEGRGQTPELVQAREHLRATNFALWDLAGEISAAYRRAAEAGGHETVEPAPSPRQGATLLPAEPGAPTAAPEPGRAFAKTPEPPLPPKPRTIEEQRDFIRNDVARQLMRAGRPKEEAEAAGAVLAARYETRAALFKGARGTAEDLYREEGAEILGPGMRSKQGPLPPRVTAPRRINEEKLSLIPFLAYRGGISASDPMIADLRAIVGDRPYPGLIRREGGMTLDRAREAAAEAGYIINEGRGGTENRGGGTSTIRTLLDAVSRESRATSREQKVYRPGMEPAAGELDPDYEEYLREQAEGELLQPAKPEVSGRIAGVQFEGTQEQFEKLQAARKAGAGRDEIARMVAEFKGEMPAASRPAIPPSSAPLFDRIRAAYDAWRADHRGYEYASIADLHAALPDIPLTDLHAELRHNPAIHLYQQDNRAILTDRDRAAALKVGADPRHLYFIDRGTELYQRQRPTEPQEIHDLPGIHIGPNFLSPGELFQIKAYHGSPHDFDRFDLSRIGTGEGAQAYGHGLYFAEEPGVAKNYRNVLSSGPEISYRGNPVTRETVGQIQDPDLRQRLYKSLLWDQGKTTDDVIAELNDLIRKRSKDEAGLEPRWGVDPVMFNDWKREVAALEKHKNDVSIQPGGKLYQVAIKADPEHFLDWDKPLSEQPHIENVLRQSGFTDAPWPYSGLFGPNKSMLRPNDTGESVYRALAKELGAETHDPAGASQTLHSAGIPGIKYLDQGSRLQIDKDIDLVREHVQNAKNRLEMWGKDAPEDHPMRRDLAHWQDQLAMLEGKKAQTRNYVVFDDSLIEITHKDGTPVIGKDREDIINELLQPARGAINLNPQRTPGRDFLGEEGVKPLLRLTRDVNASTFIHESGHQFLAELLRDAEHEAAPEQLKADAQTALKWLGAESAEKLQRRHHEKFATGFEQYLREGTAPSPSLARVFAQFKQWLLNIYQTLKGLGQPINEDIRGVFDRLLVEEPQRTVIAPEREIPRSQADVHEVDARAAAPQHADATEARIAHEQQTRYTEIPDDIRAEFDAADAQFAAEHRLTSDLGGTAATGPSGPGPVQPPGGVSEPVVPGGGGSAGIRPQRAGAARPSGEGAGLPGQRGASEGPGRERAHLGDLPLAPNPTPDLAGRDTFNVGKLGNVRTENITSVEQFASAIEEAKDRIPGTDEVMTDGQLMDAAQEMGFTPDELTRDKLIRAFGGVKDLNKKVLAFRIAVRDQAERVGDLMRRMRDEGENDALLSEYGKERERFDMFMSVLSSVTTEWGRTGRSFRNLDGWDEVMRVNLAEGVKKYTGRTLFQLKMEAKLGANLDSPAKVAKFLRDAQKRSFGGMALEFYVNNLISGVSTHVTYMIGNKLTMFQDAVPETLLASAIGGVRRVFGRQGERVLPGEAWQQVRAVGLNLPKELQGALEAVRTGQPTLLPGQTGRPLMPFFGDTTLNLARNIQNDPVTWHELAGDFYAAMKGIRDGIVGGASLISAGGHVGAPIVGAHWSPLGQIPDVAIRGIPVLPVGSFMRLPGRAVSAIHSFDTIANYSRYIAARAYREAVTLGLDGNARSQHIADRTANPPQEWMEEGHKQAYSATLMAPGGNFVKRLSALINTSANIPGIGAIRPLKFIDPFVHIGANVIEQAVLKRTPLGIFSEEIRADLMGKNGNIAQDYAQARMLAGTAMAIGFGSLAMEGYVTGSGPSDPHQAAAWREVYQPHSVRIGDMWYQVNRIGPLGMHLGIAADLYDVVRDIGDGDALQAAAHLQHAITQNILDESFMRGPSELIRALDDPGRYGEGYLKNFLSSFVPYSVGVYQMNRAADPYTRQARTVMDSIMQRVPGQSKYLQPKINMWGEEVPSPDAFAHAGLTAIYLKQVNGDPVRQAMLDLGIAPAPVPRKIRNVDLTDDEYTDFARLSGRMAKMRLDAIVRSPDWRTWPNHLRHDVIAEVVKQSREAARGRMMAKYPHIPRDAVEDLRERRLGEPEAIH